MRRLLLALLLLHPPAVWPSDFDATDDYVAVTDAATLDLSSFSLGAWIRVEAAGEQSILDKRGDASTCASGPEDEGGYQLRVHDAGFPLTLRLVVKTACTEGTLDYDGIAQNTWTHVAATFNNSTDVTILYVNGSAVNNGSTAISPVALGNNDRLLVGDIESYGNTPPTAFNFNGQIEDAFLFSGALTAQQIAIIAGSRSHRMALQFVPNLLLPLDECPSGGTCPANAVDYSANRHTAAYTGSPIGGVAGELSYP